jgi:signal transduction histidine kinase
MILSKTFSAQNEVKINANVYDVFPILKKEEIKKQIDGIFLNKKPFRISKVPVGSDSKELILSIAGFPIMVTNDITGVTLLINDITEQEQLRAQLADYEKLSALSQLALGAAHEINNPLLGITTYIELLLEEEKNVERKSRAKEVLDSAYRISETIRGLLNYARPTPPKFTKVSLNKLISETLSFLHHQPLFKKVVIEKNLSDAVPQITADANQIRQVLTNIFINAAQAMPDGGKLTVVTRKVKFQELTEIEIIDTGIGIPAEHLKKVFEPFFTTKKGGGTGLGLSISYSYIKNHSGDITLSSEPGRGTRVTITLPIRQKATIRSEVIE